MKVGFVYPAFENLGIEYISAVLKKNGHKTFLAFDPQLFDDLFVNWHTLGKIFNYKQRIIKQLKCEKPDIIAFGVVSDLFPWACQMAALIKTELNGVPIVFGGPHITALPEKVLVKPFVDYVIIGEGEYPMLELVEAIKKEMPIDNIPNLGFKRSGSVIINETRPILQNLDELPFADVDLFLSQNPYAHKEYNIMTSRGCVNSCAYCHNSVERKVLWKHNGKFLRRRSVDNVLRELRERRVKYKFDTICIWDEVFTYDIKWLEEFCNKYKKEFGLPFWTFIHPDHVSERVVQLLEEAGCYEVEIGVQTLNPWIKKNILRRPETKEDIEKAIDLFKKTKIRVVVDVIFGLPLLKDEDYTELLECFAEHTPTKIQTFWLRYYPKTDIIDCALENNLITQEELDDINNGVPNRAAASGGSKIDPRFEKYQTALTFLPYLPQKIARNLVKKNWVRFFPKISGFGHLLTRALDLKNKNDVGGRRYKGRMIYFLLKKLNPFY